MKKVIESRPIIIALFISVVVVTFLFQNCSKVSFTPTPVDASANGNVSPTVVPPSNPSAPGTAPAIGLFQPVLAVRDVSCLSCHANVQANVITDFGYGNNWYLNQNGDQTRAGTAHYMATSWQSLAQINGKVVVPNAQVPSNVIAAAITPGSTAPQSSNIQSYLNLTNVQDFSHEWYSYFGEPQPASLAFSYPVKGGIESHDYIYIGAPTSQEILALAPNSAGGHGATAIAGSSVSGFSVANGQNGSYVTNSGIVQCSGADVVISGTLFLNNLKIYAENSGCRIYVNGSVFIEGPITYLNSGSNADPTNNIQITSSNAIILGVGISGTVMNSAGQTQSMNPLETRLLDGERDNMVIRSASNSNDYTAFAKSILAEGLNIGQNLLMDAANLAPAGSVGSSAAKQSRAKIDFQHILLNAPIIHSRYLGTVTGVIISESALFSLGEFSFKYDPVFQTVPIFPALPKDILCVASSQASCNPAQ